MKFTKIRGLGSDYVCTDCFSEQIAKPEELTIHIADRHFGVGGDGLILTYPSEAVSVRMRVLSADGSEGKICGSGVRYVARYTYDHDPVTGRSFGIGMGAGTRHAEAGESLVTTDTGEAMLDGEFEKATTVDGKVIRMIPVNVGNPHAACLVDSLEILRGLDLDKIGSVYEHRPRFPEDVGSEFLYVEGPTELHMWIYERGSGEIPTCSTGATTIAFAATRFGRANEKVMVHLLGGDLILEQFSDGHFWITGSTVEIFSGSYFSE